MNQMKIWPMAFFFGLVLAALAAPELARASSEGASPIQNFCAQVFRIARIRINGGRPYVGKPIGLPRVHALEDYAQATGEPLFVQFSGDNGPAIVERRTGRTLFVFNYQLARLASGQTYISKIETQVAEDEHGNFNSDFKGFGFYSYMFHQMILDRPDIIEIHADLVSDNLAAINNLMDAGYSIAEAIKGSPSYRVYSQNGFSQIDSTSIRYKLSGDGFLSSIQYTVRRVQ
jgi:hypothetical protein